MADPKQLVNTSKFLSFVLRHKPDSIGLSLDQEGWAEVDELLACASRHGRRIERALLLQVVEADDKQRYALSEEGARVRAVQGHSRGLVSISYLPLQPPPQLFHGTAERFVKSIFEKGLQPRGRQHVHLSASHSTAISVGQRHGEPVVLAVDARQMHSDGSQFFQAENGVWLTEHVPTKYLTRT